MSKKFFYVLLAISVFSSVLPAHAFFVMDSNGTTRTTNFGTNTPFPHALKMIKPQDFDLVVVGDRPISALSVSWGDENTWEEAIISVARQANSEVYIDYKKKEIRVKTKPPRIEVLSSEPDILTAVKLAPTPYRLDDEAVIDHVDKLAQDIAEAKPTPLLVEDVPAPVRSSVEKNKTVLPPFAAEAAARNADQLPSSQSQPKPQPKPKEKWELVPGEKLDVQIASWLKKKGWQLDWKVKKSWRVNNYACFEGDLFFVVEQLLTSVKHNNAMNIRAKQFNGSKTLVVWEE